MIRSRPRVIPVLLLKNRGLVKTRQFRDPSYVGNPVNAIRVFNEKYVQELALLDIGILKESTSPDLSFLENVAGEAFFPLAYGGGVRSPDTALSILRSGFEKIILNSSIIENHSLIHDIAAITGSQSVVACVNISLTLTGSYRVYNHLTGKALKIDAIEYIREIESAGAGEIILQAVNQDGTMKGYDIRLINEVTKELRIPVIALGGAKGIPDMVSAVKAGASAVAAGSMFVFHGPHRG